METALLQVLGTALGLWDHHEKTKYLDQYVALKERYNAEITKQDSDRDDSVLDDIRDQLRVLAVAWSETVKATNPGNSA